MQGCLVLELYNSCDELLGWLIASKLDKNTSEIIDFFIWPDNRKRGYGELILNRYLAYERSKGINQIFGWLSLDDTREIGLKEATRFFSKRNFEYEHNPDAFAWSPGKIVLHIGE